MKKKELDNMLDKIAAGIRSEQVDDGAVDEATGRVWSRLDASSRIASGPPLNAAGLVASQTQTAEASVQFAPGSFALGDRGGAADRTGTDCAAFDSTLRAVWIVGSDRASRRWSIVRRR